MSLQFFKEEIGTDGTRTRNFRRDRAMLHQLNYSPYGYTYSIYFTICVYITQVLSLFYQLDFVTPGNKPSDAYSRNTCREIPKSRK
jgi:hypothetical protein